MITPDDRATCHKLKYIIDKTLGPMMDLPEGAVIIQNKSGHTKAPSITIKTGEVTRNTP